MIKSSSHIIERVTIDIEVNSIELANEIKENSNEWVRDVLSSTLLSYFSKLEEKIGDQVIQLAALGIEIDVDSLEENPKVLTNELVRKLDDSFSPLIDKVLLDSKPINVNYDNELTLKEGWSKDRDVHPLVQDSDQRVIQSLIYFLETGQLPWWIKSNLELTQMLEEQSLSNAIEKNSARISKEFKRQATNRIFIQRLVDQFSSEFIWTIVSTIIQEVHSKKIREVQIAKGFFQDLISIEPKIKIQVLSLLINSIYTRKQSVTSNFEFTLFNEIWNNANSIFPAIKLNAVQVFRFSTLVSVLSDGRVAEYSSKHDFQEKMASKMASKLDSVQLIAITNHEDVLELDQAALTIFENHLAAIEKEAKANVFEETQKSQNEKEKSESLEQEETKNTDSVSNTSEDLVNSTLSSTKEEQIISEKNELNSKISEEKVEEMESQSTDNLIHETSEIEKNELKSDVNVRNEQKVDSTSENRSESSESPEFSENIAEGTSDLLEKSEAISDEEAPKLGNEIQRKNSAEAIESNLENQELLNPSTSQITEDRDSREIDKSIVSELISSITPSKNDSQKQRNTLVDENSFLAENGGLVLLNPFLASLFKNLNFLDEKGALIETNRAVYLLHYLATGNENVFEHHLTFEKFLCGIPLNEAISREITLSNEEKEEAEQVLKSVCEHWKKLNTSSVALIRKEFLTRNCKVLRGEKSDRIKVERKAFDILLDSLPWSISMLKFPWKKELIFVEW